jgi:hypothetical protein
VHTLKLKPVAHELLFNLEAELVLVSSICIRTCLHAVPLHRKTLQEYHQKVQDTAGDIVTTITNPVMPVKHTFVERKGFCRSQDIFVHTELLAR